MTDREWTDADSGLRIVALTREDGLRDIEARWLRLARTAASPNPFYEPFMLRPALRHLARDVIPLVAVFDRHGRIGSCADARDEAALLGVLPLHLRAIGPALGRFGLREASAWKHPFCFDTTPLIERTSVATVIGALLRWSAQGRYAATAIAFERIGTDSTVGDCLRQTHADRRRAAFVRSRERALFVGGEQVAAAISGKHAKELRRLRRRLAELGHLEVRESMPADDPGEWIDAFARLERSGWKGRAGGAIGTSGEIFAFFSESVRAGWAGAQVEMLALELDGEPIAMKVDLRAASGETFAFKIAFDERWHRYSPGVLLELDAIARWNARGRAWVDSCAVPNHPMVDRLWQARRRIAEVTIGHGWLGRAMVARLKRHSASGAAVKIGRVLREETL